MQSKYIYFNSANFLKKKSLFFLILPSQLLINVGFFFVLRHLPYNLTVSDPYFVRLQHDKIS